MIPLMIKKNLLLFLASIATGASAQTAAFIYDDAGNRVARVFISSAQLPEEFYAPTEIISTTLSENNISIYPNPTKGPINVVIQDMQNHNNCEIALISLTGHILLSFHTSEPYNVLDLTECPSGLYMLAIERRETTYTHRIIKE